MTGTWICEEFTGPLLPTVTLLIQMLHADVKQTALFHTKHRYHKQIR